jgi:hypothetical protein
VKPQFPSSEQEPKLAFALQRADKFKLSVGNRRRAMKAAQRVVRSKSEAPSQAGSAQQIEEFKLITGTPDANTWTAKLRIRRG